MASSAMSVRARERRQPRHHRHVLKVSVLHAVHWIIEAPPYSVAITQSNNLTYGLGLGALAANVFGFVLECHNCAPSDSNSGVKKGFQGSGFDLGLNLVVPAV